MIFSLEILQAKHGDCLIIHYGNPSSPQFIIIDGGPGGVYKQMLKPRIERLKQKFAPDDKLPIKLLMVSHIDDDHINGVLQLMEDITSDVEDKKKPDFDIEQFWFNGFDDIIGNIEIQSLVKLPAGATVASLEKVFPELKAVDHHIVATIASTGQGRQLRGMINQLKIPLNQPFNNGKNLNSPLIRNDAQIGPLQFESGLSIQVIHPEEQRLLELQQQWDKDLKKAKENGDKNIIIASLSNQDTSPFNLASIVCLVEMKGQKILLTGDARGDDIINGLLAAKLLKSERHVMNVDILKLPHHGSDRNVTTTFFKKVKAKYYVISGDGRHHNPERATLDMLLKARKDDKFTLCFTYKTGKEELDEKLDHFIQEQRAKGRTFEVQFIESGKKSMILDLLEKVAY